MRKKYQNYNIWINASNQNKYYKINNVKIYRTCTVTRKFRKCIIDSQYGDSMASFLTQSRNCLLARFFVKVSLIIYKQLNNQNSNGNNNNNNNNNSNSQSSDSTNLINELINDMNNNVNGFEKNHNKKSKCYNLFVGSPFQFLHLSSLKYFRIDNKRVYKLLMNKFVVGNVKDILLTIWMDHACFLSKKDVYTLYGKVKNAKRALCTMDESDIYHDCKYHSLFFLDQYAGRWEKILYYKSCYCHICNQE